MEENIDKYRKTKISLAAGIWGVGISFGLLAARAGVVAKTKSAGQVVAPPVKRVRDRGVEH